MRTVSLSIPPKRSVLGYHWSGTRVSYCNFVLITSASIEFYRYIASEMKLTVARCYQFPVGHYWFEPKSGILVAANSPPKLGQMHTFFLLQDKGPKSFHGPRFSIDVSPSVTDMWTTSPAHTALLANAGQDGPPHKVLLACIYGSCHLVHLDCIRGQVRLYLLSHERVASTQYVINVPAGLAEPRVVDNLLIV